MSNQSQSSKCLRCQSNLGVGSAGGICTRCLLEEAAEVESYEIGQILNLQDLDQLVDRAPCIGDYEILSEIARGGMGVVYKARQKSLNRIVALKLLLGGEHNAEAFKRRFRAEAELAAQLKHPNIVPVFEAGEHQGQPFFSMEYVAGEDLGQLVQGGPIGVYQAIEYVKVISEAVQYAHTQGVLHRDIKPSNIILGLDGRLRITDFGLARRLEDNSLLTMPGTVLGTPGYLPPEQVSSKSGAVGPHSDIYSLGAVLFRLLTTRPPFSGTDIVETLKMVLEEPAPAPSSLNREVTKELDAVCLKCLSKNPKARFGSAGELAEALGVLLSEARSCKVPPSSSHVGRLRVRLFVWACSILIALGLILLAGERSFRGRFGGKQPKPGSTSPSRKTEPSHPINSYFVTGFLAQEKYFNIAGPDINSLISSPRFKRLPDRLDRVSSFRITLPNEYNSGARIWGLICPPKTGDYVFYISAREQAMLFLSTDHTAENARLIVFANAASEEPQRQSNAKAFMGASKPVYLKDGRQYFVEGLLKSHNPPSWLQVSWQEPGEFPPKPDAPPIPATYLGYLDPGVEGLSRDPPDVLTKEGQSARFAIGLSSPTFSHFQWLKNGRPIQGATEQRYETGPLRRSQDGDRYSCLLSSDYDPNVVSTRQAELTVVPDDAPPKLLALVGLTTTNVLFLHFDERLDAKSALDLAHYSAKENLITNATLGPGDEFILLSLSNIPSSQVMLEIRGLRDWAGNEMRGKLEAQAAISDFSLSNIRPSSNRWPSDLSIPCEENGFDVLAFGSGGFWTNKEGDSFQFTSQSVSGDFDVSVQVTRFDHVHDWAHAGLMVRESLANDAAYLALSLSPLENSKFPCLDIRAVVWTNGSRAFLRPLFMSGGGTDFPHEWLRIRRSGSIFSFFRSRDGTGWEQVDSFSVPLPKNVRVGLSTDSHWAPAFGYVSYRHLVIAQRKDDVK